MITVLSSNGSVIKIKIGQLHKPEIINRIVSLTADGEELERIKQEFANIPFSRTAKSVVWKGEFARHIYDNLE